MQATVKKLDAVIAALSSVRDHVRALDGEAIDVAAYNRSMELLNSLVEGDWDALLIAGDAEGQAAAADILMNLDAAIAFLEEYRDTSFAVAS